MHHASNITLAIKALLESAGPEIIDELEEVLDSPVHDPSLPASRPDTSHLWTPQPGPQTQAYLSEADLLFYGGAAGGGKSDLLLGLALTRHQRSVIFRKETTQNKDFVERLQSDILNTDKGWSSQTSTWYLAPLTKFSGHRILFGGVAKPNDEYRYRGRPNDLIGFDEAVDFTEKQVRFLMTWNRSTLPGQRCRVVLASNPPAPESSRKTTSGLWLLDLFAPWLDPAYPDPLGLGRPEPGELRWYVRLPGSAKDEEWSDGIPFLHEDPNDGILKTILPRSRTYIPAKVHDNVYLRNTSYLSTLQSLPEPLRSIMLEGDFSQALSDQPMALFPLQWLRDAVRRSQDLPLPSDPAHPQNRLPMTAVGMDVARGGADHTVLSPRHGHWFAPLTRIPGSHTPDGPSAAAEALKVVRDEATIVVDAVGAGGAVYDHLKHNTSTNTRAYVGSSKSTRKDRLGKFGFSNMRSQAYWRLREALDPATSVQICLPDDPDLVKELAAMTYEIFSGRIKVVPKEKLIEILGYSPDRADAVVMAWTEMDETALSAVSTRPTAPRYTERSNSIASSRSISDSRRASLRGTINYGEDKVI